MAVQVISDLDTSEEMVAWTLSVYALGSGVCHQVVMMHV
jgi:predicted MFS family arabinose efflux permease